jgi:flagellar protein FliS
MAADQFGAKAYRQTSITTANRGQILIMLYEAAIRNLKKASLAIDQNNLPEKGICIGRAHDIIIELLNTLDFEVGGAIANDIERLYNYMIEQLIEGNIGNKKEPITTCQRLLENLLTAWKEAVSQVNKNPQLAASLNQPSEPNPSK